VLFPSVVRQMPGYSTQRLGTASTLPNELCRSVYCLCVCTALLPPGGYPTAVNKYIYISKTPCGWQPGVETCRRSVLVMECILLSAYVGGCIDCKNTRGMDITKLAMSAGLLLLQTDFN
jgi:hypothetical protein